MNDGWGSEGGGRKARLLTEDEGDKAMGKDDKVER